VAQRQLYHLPDERQRLPAPTNVILADFVQTFLVFSVDRFTLVENLGLVDHDAQRRLAFDDLELYALETAVHDEGVALLAWAEVVLEVVLDLVVEEVSSHAFDGVCEGQHVDLRAVGEVVDLGDGHHVAQFHA